MIKTLPKLEVDFLNLIISERQRNKQKKGVQKTKWLQIFF